MSASTSICMNSKYFLFFVFSSTLSSLRLSIWAIIIPNNAATIMSDITFGQKSFQKQSEDKLGRIQKPFSQSLDRFVRIGRIMLVSTDDVIVFDIVMPVSARTGDTVAFICTGGVAAFTDVGISIPCHTVKNSNTNNIIILFNVFMYTIS